VRAVAQRVLRATVRVGGAVAAEMGPGLLALVGAARGDDPAAARELAQKLVHLRVFEDAEGKLNRSLLETGGTLGIVSQFTLLADVRKGRRPSFVEAAPGEAAEPLVEAVAAAARQLGAPVVSGRFGARMQVELVNDGPVTLLIDTEKRF
jgi:D-tyrosyl-tRNA(Tyr) deacylase